jgi:putative flippase GtrA
MGAAAMTEPSAPEPIVVSGPRAFLVKVWQSWATKSLAAGALATVIDLSVGATLLALGTPTRFSAMVGTIFGSTFTFLANRYFAFREHRPQVASPAVRFVAVTFISSLVHGQLVVMLRDLWGVPFVPAKMIADVCVFTFAQLFVLRYIVFPKPKPKPQA